MYSQVIGNWPTHDRFILTSCDEKYFNEYFPRFFSTFTKHWKLPIHMHLINPSTLSLQKLDKLNVSYTHCDTTHKKLNWPHWYVTYCQAQRFILLGHKITDNQSIIVADEASQLNAAKDAIILASYANNYIVLSSNSGDYKVILKNAIGTYWPNL